MTNEEKAAEFDKRVNNKQVNVYALTLQMAKWKDQQFKEYLEKKKADVMKNPYSGHCLSDMHLIDEIINELFKEQWSNEE